MKIHKQIHVQKVFISEKRPDVCTACQDFEPVIQWADDCPVVCAHRYRQTQQSIWARVLRLHRLGAKEYGAGCHFRTAQAF